MEIILTLLPDSLRFYADVLSGIRQRLAPGHKIQVVDQMPDVRRLRKLLDYWRPLGCIVDGAKGIGGLVPDAFGGVPVVYRDRSPCARGNFLDVRQDYRRNGHEAARALLRLDVRAYGFVGYCERTYWSKCRGDGFAEAVRLNGKAFHRFDEPRREGRPSRALKAWLASLPKPCALFAANDQTAKDVLDECQRADIRVPEEISILGIDNKSEICENVMPTISSIASDFERSGWICADLLYERIGNPKIKSASRTYPTLGVILRGSTRDIDDERVERILPALKEIRSRACEGLTVEDVVAILGRPRRTVELWFRQTTGKTVKGTITEVRMERARVLRNNRALSAKELAAACGYRSDTAFRIAYKAYFGVAPFGGRSGRERRGDKAGDFPSGATAIRSPSGKRPIASG